MLSKTKGIVLSTTRYSDKFSITHVFTRDFGRVSYLLPKTSGKRSKNNSLIFSPLSLIDLEVEHLPSREIQRLKEANRSVMFYDIGINITKISIVFFLSEFLTKVIRETHNNEILYDYLQNSIEILEETKVGLANFHLTFLLSLTRFMGIYPNLENYKKGCCFDLINGEFTHRIPTHDYFLREEECRYLNLLSRIKFSNMHLFKLSRNDRNLIVDRLILYYRLHLYDFPTLKSLEILKELF